MTVARHASLRTHSGAGIPHAVTGGRAAGHRRPRSVGTPGKRSRRNQAPAATTFHLHTSCMAAGRNSSAQRVTWNVSVRRHSSSVVSSRMRAVIQLIVQYLRPRQFVYSLPFLYALATD